MHRMTSFVGKVQRQISLCKYIHYVRILQLMSTGNVQYVDIFNRARFRKADPSSVNATLQQVIHQQNTMLPATADYAIWTYVTASDSSFFRSWHKVSTIIPAVPIKRSPAVKEIIIGLPVILTTYLFNCCTISFTGNNGCTFRACVVVQSPASTLYFIKQRCVYVQMYWLLVVKEYIFKFRLFTGITQAFCIRSSWWITVKHFSKWYMASKIRPKCMIVNLVYSNHV